MFYPKKRKPVTSYKDELELILYHVRRARQEMQKIIDDWHIDKLILSNLECSLMRKIREEKKKQENEEK